MRPLSILLIGLAMSTDAFAAAVGKGAAMQRPGFGLALRTGALFGLVEGSTPVLGWLLGTAAARYVTAWDHWIAFGLLLLLGLHMIWHGIRPDSAESAPRRHGLWSMLVLALGTSIDAMAVGVSLAFLDVPIAVVALVIGLCTMVMVTIGILLGRVFGALVGRRAELAGGIVMIVIGAAILHEHLGGAA